MSTESTQEAKRTATEAEQSPRERILDTATELFYRDGYRAVGIDTVIERSGVAKATLYRHFPSKDDLIVTYLERSNERFWDWFDGAIATAQAPREKLLALFEATGRQAVAPSCLGCAFQATAAEFPDAGHPGHALARAHKEEVLARLAELGREAKAARPGELAAELLLLMDGAFASARMFGSSSPASSVGAAAATLIDAQLAGAAVVRPSMTRSRTVS